MEALQRKYTKTLSALILFFSSTALAGPYIELGIGIPLDPKTGYIPDSYGIIAAGYKEPLTRLVTLDAGFAHISLTAKDICNNNNCSGDNAVEVKVIWEW